MSKQEKIHLILEQVRLCLDKQDYVRAHILSKKIAPKAFVERKGEAKGDIGIEGTAIEAAPEVRAHACARRAGCGRGREICAVTLHCACTYAGVVFCV